MTDFADDEDFQEIFKSLLNEMVAIHHCTFEEAFHVVRGEIKREYDQQVSARRAAFTVIEQ